MLPEFNTHRAFSRNFQSSRAIPTMKQIKLILKDPALPVHWGSNNAGMSSNVKFGKTKSKIANGFRRFASYLAIGSALFESKVLKVHKQWSNRNLEPFMYTKGVFTTTKEGLSNFLSLRCAPDAQPEIRELANLIYEAYRFSSPRHINVNEMHLPYVTDSERQTNDLDTLIRISAAKCAAVSYRPDNVNVERVWSRLGLEGNNPNVHASPAEHQATFKPLSKGQGANFGDGWVQFRKTIPSEFKKDFFSRSKEE